MRSHRPQRVASIIRTVVGEALAHQLSDPRIAPLSSVTHVEVSGDLVYAKVYVSVIGDEATGRRTLAGLRSAGAHVQRLVARQLAIRHCPQLSFHLDESIKRGAETIRLIEETMAQSRSGSAPEPSPADAAPCSTGEADAPSDDSSPPSLAHDQLDLSSGDEA